MKYGITKLAVLCGLTSCALNAQIKFVLSGFATTSTFDYAVNQPVSFTFTLKNDFDSTPDSYFSTTDNLWTEGNTAHDQLWSSVSGTGITGTFIRPTLSPIDPASSLAVHSTGAFGVFQIRAGADEVTSNIGISAASGTLRLIQIDLSSGGPTFSYPEVYTEPSSYFQNYFGTYAVTGQMSIFTTNLVQSEFTATNLTIIPEPSNIGLHLGIIALIGTIRRRHPRTTSR